MEDEDNDEVQIVQESARTGQSSTQATASANSRKRPAKESPAEKAAPPKKAARTARRPLESESDDDALAFPRRKGATRRR